MASVGMFVRITSLTPVRSFCSAPCVPPCTSPAYIALPPFTGTTIFIEDAEGDGIELALYNYVMDDEDPQVRDAPCTACTACTAIVTWIHRWGHVNPSIRLQVMLYQGTDHCCGPCPNPECPSPHLCCTYR